MYLYPGSALSGALHKTSSIPDHLQSYLVPGFDPILLEATGYSQLCQHYGHPELDLYVYHIYSDSTVHLFSRAETRRWVMGYLQKGVLEGRFYQASQYALPAPSVLFFPTIAGKEIQYRLTKGQHEIVCCCFKSGFDTILGQYYVPLVKAADAYPIVINPIAYSFRYEWERLLHPFAIADLFDAFLAARARLLLGLLCQAHVQQVDDQRLQDLHPGVEASVLEKAYQVKRLIDSHPDAGLGLKQLVRDSGWNLQGLKSGFLQVFGISPHQYIIQYRMQMGHALLLQAKDLSIQAIALRCGYKRPHHFISQFKAFYGKTPGELRKEGG